MKIRLTVLCMILCLAGLITLAVMLWQPLVSIFQHNVFLNLCILTVFIFGVVWNFGQLFVLKAEKVWLDKFEEGKENFPDAPKPKILKPLALLFHEPKFYPSAPAVRAVLGSIEARLESIRDVSRYITGTLVFLGLLGTFWGLSQTIGSIASVIGGLDLSGVNLQETFQNLKQGLHAPLLGMGTAFSSSLFGLLGSLVVGFFDLQIYRLANRFYFSIEERLSYLMSGQGISPDTESSAVYATSLHSQTAEMIAGVAEKMKHTEENRTTIVKNMTQIIDTLSQLSEYVHATQSITKKLAQNQIEIQELLVKVSKISGKDDGTRNHLRTIETTMGKLLEELIEGRQKTTGEIRGEIRILSKTITSLAHDQEEAA